MKYSDLGCPSNRQFYDEEVIMPDGGEYRVEWARDPFDDQFFGEFEITTNYEFTHHIILRWGRDGLRCTYHECLEGHPHPHISGPRVCLGDNDITFLAEQHQYFALLSFASVLLQTCDLAHGFSTYDFVECVICSEWFHHDDASVADCGHWTCHACLENNPIQYRDFRNVCDWCNQNNYCKICGREHRGDYYYTTNANGREIHVCTTCYNDKTCKICNRVFTRRSSVRKCDQCGKEFCSRCSSDEPGLCEQCGRSKCHFCEKLTRSNLKIRDNTVCIDCYRGRRCTLCHEFHPVNRTTQCPECGFYFCKDHMGDGKCKVCE